METVETSMSGRPSHELRHSSPLPADPAADTVPLPIAKPVFVDPSGRRRRAVRVLAVIGCVVLGGYGVLMAAALLGAPLPRSVLLPPPAQPSVTQAAPPAPPSAPLSTTSSTDTQPAQLPPPPTGSAPSPQAQEQGQQATTTSVPPGQAHRRNTTPPGKSTH